MNAPDLTAPLMPTRPSASTAAAETDQARAIAEVQGQMILAKKFPRDEIRARDKILNSCMRKGLAEVSQFCFSRGGSEVTGPSIDLLTVIAAHWGNLLHSWRELSRSNGQSEIEAFAWDMETNTKVSRTLTVKHIRDTKKGPKPVTEERDINELCANWASRWVRTCLEKIVPPDIIDDAVAQCNATLNSKAQVTPERIKGMVEQFAEFNITKEMIEARIQRHLDTMTPSQLVSISRIYKSIKEGMSKPEDWFEKKDIVGAKSHEAATKQPGIQTEETSNPDINQQAGNPSPPAPAEVKPPEPKPAAIPDFDINNFNLDTPEGLKEASAIFLKILAEHPQEARNGIFKQSSGVTLSHAMRSHGLALELTKFEALGVTVPPAVEGEKVPGLLKGKQQGAAA